MKDLSILQKFVLPFSREIILIVLSRIGQNSQWDEAAAPIIRRLFAIAELFTDSDKDNKKQVEAYFKQHADEISAEFANAVKVWSSYQAKIKEDK